MRRGGWNDDGHYARQGAEEGLRASEERVRTLVQFSFARGRTPSSASSSRATARWSRGPPRDSAELETRGGGGGPRGVPGAVPATRRSGNVTQVTSQPTDRSSPTLPDHAVIPAVWSRITDLDVDRGEGSWLITRSGERYLDYTSGIGVTNTGHAHPRVAAAIAAQAQKLIHGQQNILFHEPGLRLHARLQSRKRRTG